MGVAWKLSYVRFALDVQFWFPTWFFLLKSQGFSTSVAIQADLIFHLVILIAELPAARVVTAIGRVRSLQITTAATIVVFLGLAFANSIPVLFSIWALWGLLWALASGLDTAYTWEVAESGFVSLSPTRFLSLIRAISGLSIGISLITAGFLFEIDPRLPYIITAALAFSALPITFLLPEPSARPKHIPTPSDHIRSTISTKPFNQGVMLLAGAVTVSVSIRILIQPVGIEFALSPTIISIFYTLFAISTSIGSSLGALWGEVISFRKARALLLLLGALYIPAGLLFEAHRSPMLGPVWIFGSALCFGILRSISEVKISMMSDLKRRVTNLSIASLISGLTMAILRPAMMWTYTQFGILLALSIATITAVVFASASRKMA